MDERERSQAEQFDEDQAKTAALIARAMRVGMHVPDPLFDSVLDRKNRERSTMFWTPVAVAQDAASWLQHFGARSVLDVGSGIGKFAVIAALGQSELEVVGVEQRASLVRAARALAALFTVSERVRFVEADYTEGRAPPCDAIYAFNPFGENLFDDGDQIDDSAPRSFERFRQGARAVTDHLKRMPVGAFFCTYNGFGGRVPQSFELLRESDAHRCPLRLWRKRSMFSAGPDLREEDLADRLR